MELPCRVVLDLGLYEHTGEVECARRATAKDESVCLTLTDLDGRRLKRPARTVRS